MNRLYYGDNLEILRKEIKDESVDLIYLDPPFNSKREAANPDHRRVALGQGARAVSGHGDGWANLQACEDRKPEDRPAETLLNTNAARRPGYAELSPAFMLSGSRLRGKLSLRHDSIASRVRHGYFRSLPAWDHGVSRYRWMEGSHERSPSPR